MGATPLTPVQRVDQTTQTLQRVFQLAQHGDVVHLQDALSQLGQCPELQECHCTQFIALFERLNALVCEHNNQLSSGDHKRWTQFALMGKNIAPALARHLVATEEWGRNLPALNHFMILSLFESDEHPDVQRDLLVAQIERGYQTFHLCCDMHWTDDTRYSRLLDKCEAVIGENPGKLVRFGEKPKP